MAPKPPNPTNYELLARVNFPLYSVEMLTSRHCIVAGGGGSAKTGVSNGFVSGSGGNKFTAINAKLVRIPIVRRTSTRSTTTASGSWPRNACASTPVPMR